MVKMDYASGIPSKARTINSSRTAQDLGVQMHDLKTTLKAAVDSLIECGHVRTPAPKLRLLHLMGSPASTYYETLSTMYAKGCVESNAAPCAAICDFVFAVVHPEGPSFSFPTSLDPAAMAAAPRFGHGEGIAELAKLEVDVCQSHMFCTQGVSIYRALLDLLNIPFLGGSVDAMTLTTHKGRSRDVVAAAGVPVAEGEVLRNGEAPTMKPPFILKPCSEDNSMGVSLVKDESQIEQALLNAYEFDDEVLCEAFVPPGRELRVAVIEDSSGEPSIVLPAVEYFMSQEKPIRTSNDKLTGDPDKLTFAKPARQCPADVDEVLMEKLVKASRTAHIALGCRDYSLYDFRIDPEGNPFMLEASLFCCFAPNSVISMMGDATGESALHHQTLFQTLIKRAAARKVQSSGNVASFGSKVKKLKTATAA